MDEFIRKKVGTFKSILLSSKQSKIINKKEPFEEYEYNETSEILSIDLLKKRRESYSEQLSSVQNKIDTLRREIKMADAEYNKKASEHRKGYSRLDRLRHTPLSEVQDAFEYFENVKNRLEPIIEKYNKSVIEINKKVQDIKIQINELEDEYIAEKIKPHYVSKELQRYKNTLTELNFGKTLNEAREKGYIPASEFIDLVINVEGEYASILFLQDEPDAKKTGEYEYFVVLYEDTFKYSKDFGFRFRFNKTIEYSGLSKTFELSTVSAIKYQEKKPHKLIVDAYESGEVFQRIKMYKTSNFSIDAEELKKWELIKNKYETGHYETDEEKIERTSLENDQKKQKALEKEHQAERKQKSFEFIKNFLPVYKKFYSRISKDELESHFYTDKKNKIIFEMWLDAEIEFRKSKEGRVYAIKPCIYGCTSSNYEYKFAYKSEERINYDPSEFRVYECEASERSDFKGWHLTSQLE